KFSRQLNKWRTATNISQLYKRIETVQKIKTIWQVDKEVKLMTFYYPSKLIIDDTPKEITAIKQIPAPGNFVIQGTVGQGKSIFLRYLSIRELAQSQRIPIFAELRRVDETGLIAFLRAQLKWLGFEMDDDMFDFYAGSGKMILLLDGFDELE